MAAQTPTSKLSKHIADTCADVRMNEVGVANYVEEQHGDIQARFFNILIAYIYTMAHNYEIGKFHNNTYEIARVCKKIKDIALSDEYSTAQYELYGDYEIANNLTLFDPA